MSNKDINLQAKELAKEVIFEIKKQQKDRRLHNTKLLMKNYNKLKNHIDKVNTNDYLGYFEDDIADLIDGDVFIRSIMRTKARTAQMVACIDVSLSILKEEYTKKDAYYIFDSFWMYYVEGYTYEEISEKYNAGKNTPSRWTKEVLNKLNILLWGVEALGI